MFLLVLASHVTSSDTWPLSVSVRHQPPPTAISRDTTPIQPKEGKKVINKPVEKNAKM